ncbi:hypothetical protein [Streptomyces sp. NBC_01006]|nr:hypothetical protein OG509_37805 [Streptomyces sp. NBC_01006]
MAATHAMRRGRTREVLEERRVAARDAAEALIRAAAARLAGNAA